MNHRDLCQDPGPTWPPPPNPGGLSEFPGSPRAHTFLPGGTRPLQAVKALPGFTEAVCNTEPRVLPPALPLFIHAFIYFCVLFKTRVHPITDGTKILPRLKKKTRRRKTLRVTKLRQTTIVCCSVIWGERNNSKLFLRAMRCSSRGPAKDFRYVAGNSIMLTNSA